MMSTVYAKRISSSSRFTFCLWRKFCDDSKIPKKDEKISKNKETILKNEDEVSKNEESSSKNKKLIKNEKKSKSEELIPKNEKLSKNEEAQRRLAELLDSFNKTSESTISSKLEGTLAKPKLKNRNILKKSKKKKITEVNAIENVLEPQMVKAVKSVSELLDGDPTETASELVKALRSHTAPSQSAENVFSGLKIELSVDKDSQFQKLSEQKERTQQNFRGREHSRDKKEAVHLFGAQPLGIFDPEALEKSSQDEKVSLKVWDSLIEREIRLSAKKAPKNYFEELIEWRNEGKVWTLPLDNEYGLEEEKKCTFADHIFLEKHLHPWCPTKGPIRHFMELVCVGLSKNPHLTVARKLSHIEWYKNYLGNKNNVLEKIGVETVKSGEVQKSN